MINKALIQKCRLGQMQAKIVSTSECSKYLVGAESPQGEFFNLTSEHSTPVFYPSIEQARSMFREHGVDHIDLELHTAYDEMIGMNK